MTDPVAGMSWDLLEIHLKSRDIILKIQDN